MSTSRWTQGSSEPSGYVPPGSYAAPGRHQHSPSWDGMPMPVPQIPQQSAGSSFKVVRGGKATDQSPYTLSTPLAGARGLVQPPRNDSPAFPLASQPNNGQADYFASSSSPINSGRTRAHSQSASIELASADSHAYLQPPGHRRQSSGPPDFFSNHPSPGASSGSATIPPPPATAEPVRRGFFGRFGNKKRNRNSDDWSDDDDEDDDAEDGAGRSGRGLWPFSRGKAKAAEPVEPEPEPATKSFAVTRRPRPAPTTFVQPPTAANSPVKTTALSEAVDADAVNVSATKPKLPDLQF